MGSKARFAKEILPIVLEGRKPGQWYVEPFAGGMNMISEVKGNRIANDRQEYLIAMWEALVQGWRPPRYITKEEYYEVKNLGDIVFDPCLVGWVGFNCSFRGKWFGGFAGRATTLEGKEKCYQTEAINNVSKQIAKLNGVIIKSKSYELLELPSSSILYCDPPYEGTTGYRDSFDNTAFWQWCRERESEGHSVYVSEYNAPKDFICVWEKQVKESMSLGERGFRTEKLFKYEPLLG